MSGRQVVMVLVALLFSGVVVSSEPQPCCFPKQFTAVVGSVNAGLLNGVLDVREKGTPTAYDAINEKVAEIVDAYNDVTGTYVETKFIYDFKEKKKYIIQGKDCRFVNLPYEFTENCIPTIARYRKTMSIGLGAFDVKEFEFEYPDSPSYNTKVKIRVGLDECVPYQTLQHASKQSSKTLAVPGMGFDDLMMAGTLHHRDAKANDGVTQALFTVYQYTDYETGIKDPSFWFEPPKGCLKGHEGGEPATFASKPVKNLPEIIRKLLGRDNYKVFQKF